MLDLEETFVYDAVIHAYNLERSNYLNERHAEAATELIYGAITEASPPGYKLTREGFIRDWGVGETSRMVFLESDTDMGTFQPIPLTVYKDGLVADEKAIEAKERWPQRYRTYVSIDPLGEDPIGKLEEAVETFDPIGVKMYPSSWTADDHRWWRMDDEEVAFPVFERARELGIDLIAIHKALPVGTVPTEPYKTEDVDEAATSFPDMTFSIVHGGLSFAEETGWQLGRYPNIYVNLEVMGQILAGNEPAFAEAFGELLSIGGERVIDQIVWGSGASSAHPQVQLEAFRDFQFPERLLGPAGKFGPIPQLTDEHKRKILGENYADLVGIDIEEAKEGFADDEFAQQRAENGDELAEPYTTTEAAAEVM